MSEEEEERGFKVTDRRGQPKEEKTAEAEPEEKAKEEVQSKPESEPEASSQADPEPGAQGGHPVDFQALCFSLTTSAMISMGIVENPQTKKKEKDLMMAKQQIDVLEMLQTKTKGNLTETEEKFLTDALYQLRMVYVEASK